MRSDYLLKSFAAALFVFFITNLSAKEITVKANGTDSDVATALDQAETGDVIVIAGTITFDAPVTIEKNVKFTGKNGDGSDYFWGQGKTKLFEIAPEPIEGEALLFENLGFAEGYNDADGGVGRIISGNTEFVNCWFEDNYSNNHGGAFYIAADGTNVRFAGCETNGNTANNRGGFVCAVNNVTTSFEYCKIMTNNNQNDRGGAFYFENGSHRFFYTNVEGNTNDGQGGAAFTTAGTTAVTMESGAIVHNITSHDHGAVFFLMDKPNITLINTTIAENQTNGGAGSWFLATNDCDITLVNVTMAYNTGDNPGNAGGGIRVMNDNNRINIFNSILARNLANNGDAIDIGYFNTPPSYAKHLVFKNSIVGLVGFKANDDIPAAQDNPDIANQSLINMYRLAEEDSQPDYVALDVSGVDFEDGLTTTANFKMPYYTLRDNTVYAAELGDPALLMDYDTNTDQLLVKRTETEGAVFAGSVQAVTKGVKYNDSGWEENVFPIYSSIHAPAASIALKQGIRIIGTPSNGILGVDFGDLKGHAVGTLMSVAGREIEKVFDLNVVSKGYYNIHAAPGMYILKVNIGGKIYAQKLIVTK